MSSSLPGAHFGDDVFFCRRSVFTEDPNTFIFGKWWLWNLTSYWSLLTKSQRQEIRRRSFALSSLLKLIRWILCELFQIIETWPSPIFDHDPSLAKSRLHPLPSFTQIWGLHCVTLLHRGDILTALHVKIWQFHESHWWRDQVRRHSHLHWGSGSSCLIRQKTLSASSFSLPTAPRFLTSYTGLFTTVTRLLSRLHTETSHF